MSTPPKPSQPPDPPEQPPAPPSAYTYPPPAGGYAPPGPYAAPYAATSASRPGGSGGAGRAVLWAAVGAVVASAAWAVAFLALDAGKDDADLRGYTAAADLCGKADHSSFDDEYPDDSGSPTHNSLKDTALDQSYCSLNLKKTTSSYADAYLTLQMDLHKQTDPGPEFRAVWKKYGDLHDGYDVDTVDGIGDEAYLVSQDTAGDTTSGSRYATLAVRDGWMTWTMTYSSYLTSYDEDKDPPKLDEVTDWLKTDTESTLEALKA